LGLEALLKIEFDHMELSPKQQFIDLINKSTNPLILTHQRPDGDALGSLLALQMVLKKMGKQVSAICVDPVPQVFSFLPDANIISQEFSGTRDFVISVDASTVKPDKIFYKVEDDKLNIVITPKQGQFKHEMVTIADGNFKYDLIIVLDSTDPERLGISFEGNPDLFYETPVINIDHHPGNDYFGAVNIVDLTATSTSEILVSLIEALGQKFDEDMATALLTGITTDTGSFQNANTTPKSLTIAAQLVAAGGRQQEIVRNIYKTRSLSTLRLWGLVLSNMKQESEGRFIWSVLSMANFAEAGAKEDESNGVIDELLKTASGVDFALLLSERNGGVHGSLRSVAKGVDVSAIATLFGGGGHTVAAAFQVEDTTLEKESQNIIDKIKRYLGQTVITQIEENNQQTRAKIQNGDQKPEIKAAPVEKVAEVKTPDQTEVPEIVPEQPAEKTVESPVDDSEAAPEESTPKW
jgi:phosphoesterase RecJ-like protein